MRRKRTIKSYIKATLIPLIANIILFIFFYLIGNVESTKLIDAFQASGLLVLLFICLIIVHQCGAFDFIVFGVTRLFARLFPWGNVDMSKTYFDYVTEKKEDRKVWPILWPGLIVSSIFIIIGFFLY